MKNKIYRVSPNIVYTEITRRRVGACEKNERQLIREELKKGFKLVDKRPQKDFTEKNKLYWYYFDKSEVIDTGRPIFKQDYKIKNNE